MWTSNCSVLYQMNRPYWWNVFPILCDWLTPLLTYMNYFITHKMRCYEWMGVSGRDSEHAQTITVKWLQCFFPYRYICHYLSRFTFFSCLLVDLYTYLQIWEPVHSLVSLTSQGWSDAHQQEGEFFYILVLRHPGTLCFPSRLHITSVTSRQTEHKHVSRQQSLS